MHNSIKSEINPTSDNILYYPYINVPDSLWTTKALLYWDNVGVIAPNDYRYDPEKFQGRMRDLISAGLVEQIDPREFTEDIPTFKDRFLDIVLATKFNVNGKRKKFLKGEHFQIHVEKFDNGLMEVLRELGLAERADWPWWNVEENTANVLMTYLAAIISIRDNRTPLTDNIITKEERKLFVRKRNDKITKLRSRILEDVLPLPAEIDVRKLERIKGRYSCHLKRFRNKIENLILTLKQVKDEEDFEVKYRLEIEELLDTKAILCDELNKPEYGKLIFGTLSSVSATAVSVAQTPNEQMLWTIPSIVSGIYSAVDSHKKNSFLLKQPLTYLALIDKQLKK